MLGNLAKVGEKAQSRGICVLGEFYCGSATKKTYLYFIRTVIHFS